MDGGESLVFSRGESMSGTSKTPPTTEEKAKIATMAAGGMSQAAIARSIDRSRHMVKNVIAEPEIQRSIQDERAVLSALCRDKARDIFVSINSGDIDKANLLAKATAGAIMLDKALLLAGEALPIVHINILMDAVGAIRSRQAIAQPQTLTLPLPPLQP
jgi:glycosyltransferase A (GT-A) superfamily protein (DUF2064 family)